MSADHHLTRSRQTYTGIKFHQIDLPFLYTKDLLHSLLLI